MSSITTHVLDATLGRPAEGVGVRLDVFTDDGSFQTLAERNTNADGRVLDFLRRGALEVRTYRLTFETGAYYAATGQTTFYPWVEIVFRVAAADQHHHVPLLLSPFGYSTYRGT
jgi:5-hydroxyisourate hydrolase